VKRLRNLTVAALVGIAALNLSLPSPAAVPPASVPFRPQPADQLSVMTYNVEGLPFPVAYGRAGKLAEIGARLADLRRAGRQPHVVLLQEAFIPQAKAIASAAGYAHVALGPQISDVRDTPDGADGASWLRGEGLGKWTDGGLVILSDYPIVRTRKMAFPAAMCAGFDCLAAKGVLIAWVKVPGRNEPVAIADTHLNSRKASGVGVDRANAAYARQVAAVRGFLRANVPATSDVIFGGDFNTGHDKARIAAQMVDGGVLGGGSEAMLVAAASAHTSGMALSDRSAILARAKDKQYFRASVGSRLALHDLEVPFGIGNGGSELSDHIGYVAHYAL
jgi:endonuclease/exonuclease/phosphatase family metal-dependent hydrolase